MAPLGLLSLRHLRLRQRQGLPHAGPALRHPQLRHGAVLPPVHGSCDGALEERVQAVHRLPGGADGNEDGLRPPEGGGGPFLPSHRAPPRDRQTRSPCPVSVVPRMLCRHAPGDPPVARHPAGHRLPLGTARRAPGAREPGDRRDQERALPGDVEQLHLVLRPDASVLHAGEVRSGQRVRHALALAWGVQMDARSGGSAGQPRLPDPACARQLPILVRRGCGREPQRPGPQVQGGWGDLQQQLGLQDRCGLRSDRQGRTDASGRRADAHAPL